MIKDLIIVCLAMLIMLFSVGCEMSKAKITRIVAASLQKSLSFDPQYMETNMKLKELTIERIEKNSYRGIAKIEYTGVIHSIPLLITVKNSGVTWELEPGALAFIPR